MAGGADGTMVVVGAGVAGLACASALAASGRQVLVLERARGVGGRCATRRLDGQPFDSGPAFVHGRDPRFLAALDEVPATRLPGWPSAVEGTGTPCQPRAFEVGERRLAWAEGVNALPRHLARGLDVRLESEVTGLALTAQGVRLALGAGESLTARVVVLAGAPEQSARLLRPLGPAASPAAGVVAMLDLSATQACLALLALYPEDAPRPGWHVHYPDGTAILLTSHDSAKRPAGARLGLVFQARAAWSRAHLTDPGWPEALLAEAATLYGPWAARPARTYAHRWSHARQDGGALLAGPVVLAVPGGRIGLCGDRFGQGGGVEGAWRSGRALAGRLLAGA